MNKTSEKIPFAIEISRMIELLAGQIYPTPFALLRENVQNAFDAILLRQHAGQRFDAKIDVTIEPDMVRVMDNGIGMTWDDLRTHFWRAGSSSKNTDDARAAGVVGTFGIGAMANFGIAEELLVESESAMTGERNLCMANRSTLSVTEDCIKRSPQRSKGEPGTIVTAKIEPEKLIDVEEAKTYITQFVAYLPIVVNLNGRLISKQSIDTSVPPIQAPSWTVRKSRVDLGDGFATDIDLSGAVTGDLRVALSNIE